ncbi:MAG: ankyrin repeat domain-containing protein [Gammaproteobacteria bacterium]|nr:ankyrin repeat domain-containing protein [Gammaproteobacteria bacterium]
MRPIANAIRTSLAALLLVLPVIGPKFALAATDLATAVRDSDHAAVDTLLGQEAARDDINAHGYGGMTPLLWAVLADDLALAGKLLVAGADANLGNRYGIFPLWLAATNRSAAMTSLLLEHGADSTMGLPHGETALMAAARAGDADTIRLLLDAGADPNAREATLGETALIWAAAENHPAAIAALIAGGADPDLASSPLDLAPMDWVQIGMVSTVLPVGGWTPLMTAARQNSADAAAALVAGGADLDRQDPDGTTALVVAIINRHYDLAAALLEAGADPDVADRTGMTALYAAVDIASLGPDIGLPPRPRHDTLQAIDIVRIALEHGADPNARLASAVIGRHHGLGDFALGEGATALMRAAKSNDTSSMRLLLDAGADPGLQMANGQTVFDIVERGRGGPIEEAAALLREYAGESVGGGAGRAAN